MENKITDILIEGNNLYQWKLLEGEESLKIEENYPKLSTLILTCMDPRIDVYRIFQLNLGDVFVLRNAGNVLTDDMLRGILIAIFKYKVRNIIVLGHIDCGMKKLSTRQLRDILNPGSLNYICGRGYDVGLQLIKFFKIFADEIFNIKNQMGSISAFRGLPVAVNVIGMLYDVETGWVYDYEDIKDLESYKDFHFYKKDLAKKKRDQFLDFLDGVEDYIKKKPKAEQIKIDDDYHYDRKPVTSEKFYRRTNQNLLVETYRIMIKYKDTLPDKEIIEIYEKQWNEIRKYHKDSGKSFRDNHLFGDDRLDVLLNVIKEIFPPPYQIF